jgi:hypothetical protein
MDVREFRFWAKQAQKKRIEDRLSAITVARMSMADVGPVRMEINRLQWSLKLLELEEKREGDKDG